MAQASDDYEYDPDDGIDPIPHAHARVGDKVTLENGRIRFTLLCDDGQDEEVEALAKRLNKRLAKFGQSLDIISKQVSEVESYWKPGKMDRVIKLTLETPPMSGKKAKLIGSFERAEDGEQVYRYAFDGHTEADLEPFLGRWSDCDHCQKSRQRNATFLCETEEGERVLIGRQCSMDYLGLDPSDILARHAVFYEFLNERESDAEYFGPRAPRMMDMEYLVMTAYRVAKRYGGYSKDIKGDFLDDIDALYGARDYGRSTFYKDIRRWYREAPAPEPLDKLALADYVFNQRGNFWADVQIALEMRSVRLKRRNIIIAGIGLFVGRRETKPKEEKAVQKRMAEGVKDQRVDFVGTIVRTTPYETDFGPKTVIVILTDKGETCVHFSAKEHNPEAGKRYAIRATITKQDDEKQQTVLARAVYTETTQGELFATA